MTAVRAIARSTIAGAALLAASIASAETPEPPLPESVQCALDNSPEGTSAKLLDGLIKSLKGEQKLPLDRELLDRIKHKCGGSLNGDPKLEEAFGAGFFSVHVKREAGARLMSLGFDPVRIDNLLRPAFEEMSLEVLQGGGYTPAEKYRRPTIDLLDEAVETTGGPRDDVAPLFITYMTGLAGEVMVIRTL